MSRNTTPSLEARPAADSALITNQREHIHGKEGIVEDFRSEYRRKPVFPQINLVYAGSKPCTTVKERGVQ